MWQDHIRYPDARTFAARIKIRKETIILTDIHTITRKKGGVIVWSDDQVSYIRDKYLNQNSSLAAVCNEFHISPETMRNMFRRNNIPLKGCKQGYPRNENYFSNIDTPAKAYWLGMFYADGTVSTEKRSEISLRLIDKEHVEKFKRAIEAINHKIGEAYDTRWSEPKVTYTLSIRDKQLASDLSKWGCVQNKTLIINKIPNIPRDYVSHFLRGYFDGDGSLHYLRGTDNYRISFTCGNPNFLEDVKKELGVNVSLGHAKDTNTYQLQISGRHQVERILNYLYKGSEEETRLNRKYQKYLDCLEWVHRH